MRIWPRSMTVYRNNGRQALVTFGGRGVKVFWVFENRNQWMLPRTGTLDLGRPVHRHVVTAERGLRIGLKIEQGRTGTTGACDRRWSVLGGAGTFPGHR